MEIEKTRELDEREQKMFDMLTDENDVAGVGRRFIMENPSKPLMDFIMREAKEGNVEGLEPVIAGLQMALKLTLTLAKMEASAGETEVDPNE